MKQYDGINQNKSEKKLRSYDISSELNIKSEPEKKMKTYDFKSETSHEYDLIPPKKSNKPLRVFMAVLAILLCGVFGLSYAGYINLDKYISQAKSYIASTNTDKNADNNNNTVNDSDNSDSEISDTMFTHFDNSTSIELEEGQTLDFSPDASNAKKDISIEYSIIDVDTDSYYCDEIVPAGNVFKWNPSDYIHDFDSEHKIGITQTAYYSNDTTTPIGTYYSELTINILSNN